MESHCKINDKWENNTQYVGCNYENYYYKQLVFLHLCDSYVDKHLWECNTYVWSMLSIIETHKYWYHLEVSKTCMNVMTYQWCEYEHSLQYLCSEHAITMM